jgi:hypothetical protein
MEAHLFSGILRESECGVITRIKKQEVKIMAEYASRGVGGSGLGLGIAGTALGILNGGLGNILGGIGGNCGCHENMPVTRYELGQEAKIADLQSQIALRDANTYNDQKLLEVYKYFDGKLEGVNARLCDQTVWNATQTATIGCMAQQIAALNGLTKLIVPASSVCPAPMPQYNSWTAPTTTTTTTG